MFPFSGAPRLFDRIRRQEVMSLGVGGRAGARRGQGGPAFCVWLVLLVALAACGPRQSPVDYPSRIALLTQLQGRLGTLRNTPDGTSRGFQPDLDVSRLAGVPTIRVRARLGPPLRCGQLPASKRARICVTADEMVYPFFVGQPRGYKTYLVVDASSATGTVRRAVWRTVL